jgi:polysaccharide export outer membrane protein
VRSTALSRRIGAYLGFSMQRLWLPLSTPALAAASRPRQPLAGRGVEALATPRSRQRWPRWAIALSGLALACSPVATESYRDVSSDLRDAVAASTLGPGDVVAIRVYLHPDLNGDFEVSASGTITFPLLGDVTCEGLTASELGARLRDGLATGFLRDPHVVVGIKAFNSKKVYVLGQVAKPGRLAFSSGMTIIEALTLAGGFSALAEKNYTIVTRNDRRIALPVEKIMQGLARNFVLQPGDIVYVPKSVL